MENLKLDDPAFATMCASLFISNDASSTGQECALSHDVQPRVHVKRTAGETSSVGCDQERGGHADIIDIYKRAQGRMFFGLVQKRVEVLRRGRSAGLDRAGGDS